MEIQKIDYVDDFALKSAIWEHFSNAPLVPDCACFDNRVLQNVPILGLEIKGFGKLGLPLNDFQGKHLTLLKTTEGNNPCEFSAEEIKIHNGQFSSSVLANLKQNISMEFGISCKVDVKFRNLSILSNDARFVPEKLKDAFATIFICLPSDFSGGEIEISDEEATKTLDFSEKSSFHFQYAGMLSYCKITTKPVTNGYQGILVYDVFREDKLVLNAPLTFPDTSTLESLLDKYNQPLIHILDHDYGEGPLTLVQFNPKDKQLLLFFKHIADRQNRDLIVGHVKYHQYENNDSEDEEEDLDPGLGEITPQIILRGDWNLGTQLSMIKSDLLDDEAFENYNPQKVRKAQYSSFGKQEKPGENWWYKTCIYLSDN
jgi:hypothetical protein